MVAENDSELNVPPRVARAEEARRLFPSEFARLVPALACADPLAERAVEELALLGPAEAHRRIRAALSTPSLTTPALAQLIEEARKVPPWVDWSMVDSAGEVFFRSGLLGGIVLGARSLVYGYAAPVGNKPLAFSGALEKQAQRRLAETGEFVRSVSAAQQMRPGASGHDSTILVRLMHAQVRRLALKSPNWDKEAWGVPINQHDMLATVLLFSVVFLEGLRLVGVDFTRDEAERHWLLWRYVGVVIGVDARLLPERREDALRAAEFIRLTQGTPDADSRALVRALLDVPLGAARTPSERWRAGLQVDFAEGVCRALLDDSTADALMLRSTFSTGLVPRVRSTFEMLGKVRHRIAPLDRWVNQIGARYWAFNLKRGLKGGGALFPLPWILEGRSRATSSVGAGDRS
jgi:hypothetical protein